MQQRVPLGAADWLSLAAAPTFALMALLTALRGAQAMALCTGSGLPSWLAGMAPMYVLMAAFHLAPWLRVGSATFSQFRRDN